MPITTPLTQLLGIKHPILLAPMDTIAGSRLTRAVSEAGGFGILGGGYGDQERLEAETGQLSGFASFGIGFITWSLARQPRLLDIALDANPQAIMLSFGDPAPFAARIKARAARLICQVQSEDMAKQALGGRGHPDCAGHRSRRPRSIAHHRRYRACNRRSRGRAGAGGCGRRNCRWSRARRDDDAGRLRRADRHALLCERGGQWRGGSQAAHSRR